MPLHWLEFSDFPLAVQRAIRHCYYHHIKVAWREILPEKYEEMTFAMAYKLFIVMTTDPNIHAHFRFRTPQAE